MSTTYWYRAEKISAVLMLDFNDLYLSLLQGGLPSNQVGLLSNYVTTDLYSIINIDKGESPTQAAQRPVVKVELLACQFDYTTNGIAMGTGVVEAGRDLTDGVPVISVTSLLRRYLTTRVKATVYEKRELVAAEGINDSGDNDVPLAVAENRVLFDGYLSSVSARSNAGTTEVVFELINFLCDLANSSALTGDIAASSLQGLNFTPGMSPYVLRPLPTDINAGFISTLVGMGQVALGGGVAVRADFWGYNVPKDGALSTDTFGVKGFLEALANQNVFNWYELTRFQASAVNTNECSNYVPRLKNNNALAALDRIEPRIVAGSQNALSSNWQAIHDFVQTNTSTSSIGLTRADINTALPGRLAAVGYQYGVPVPLRGGTTIINAINPSTGFAADLAFAITQTMGPTTLWDTLVSQCLSRYGMCLSPMSTRAVVLPFAPAITKVWQYIRASEYFHIDAKFETPPEIRGVMLINPVINENGVFPGGNSVINVEQTHAVFDTCRDGQWIIRHAPSWLTNLNSPYAYGAAKTLTKKIPYIGDPRLSQQALIDLNTPLAAVVGGAGLAAPAITTQIRDNVKNIGYNLAKAVYQQKKLEGRVLHVHGRYRLDIGPGSTIKLEVMDDKWVTEGYEIDENESVEGLGTENVIGFVTRVTVAIDARTASAGTNFEVGFVRMPGEINNNGDMTSNGHPYWTTNTVGVPLVDCQEIRNKIGTRDNIL